MPKHPPLNDIYPVNVTLVLLALCPNIIVSTAAEFLSSTLQQALHTSKEALQITEGLSNAAYAFGAVLAVALLMKWAPQRLLLGYELMFIAGSVAAAVAPAVQVFALGRIVQGFATGLLLVAALPPLGTTFGVSTLPITAVVTNLGLFGASTAGPLLGGLAATLGWRWLFGALAGVGVLAFGVGYACLGMEAPGNPDHRLDKSAVALSVGATVLPFFAVSQLDAADFFSAQVLVPLLVGLGFLIALLLVEFHRARPLMPIPILVHTFSVCGVVAAMAAGAGFVGLVSLVRVFLTEAQKSPPLSAGLLFWPQILGLVVACVLYWKLFHTRYIPVLVLVGMLVLMAGAALLTTVTVSTGPTLILIATGALGFGAGAAVSPGLFIAAMSAPSAQLGPAFALIELLRAEAAFMLSPVLVHVATTAGGGKSPAGLAHGVSIGTWAVLGLIGLATVVVLTVFVLGGVRLHRPDLRAWLDEGDEAFHSPVLASLMRSR
jgi:MFS family permease